MLALYLQCSVTSFYHWEVPVIFFEKFKQLWFQFARIFSLFLTHSFYIEAYPFSLYAICYQIPWGKQLEKWEVIFFPRLFLFPQESANLCVFLSIFFFFILPWVFFTCLEVLSCQSILMEVLSCQSILMEERQRFILYTDIWHRGILWIVSLGWEDSFQGVHYQRTVAGRQASSKGRGRTSRQTKRAAALWRPSWRGSLSLFEPSICTTCGNPDSPLPPLCSCSSFQTPSRSPPQADQSVSLGTSQTVTRSFHVYLNRKRDLTSPSWFNFSCDSESCPEHLWKQQGSPLTLKAAGSAGSPSSLIPSAPVVSELLPGLQDLCSEYIWCHFSEWGRPHNDEKLALYPTVGYTRQVHIF